MSWRLTALSLLAVACLVAASHTEEATNDSAENVVKAWVTALNENDPEKLLAFYDRSEEMEVVVSAGVRYRGFKAVQKVYGESYKDFRFYDSSAKGVSGRLLGDTAIVTFEHIFKVRVEADDSRWQIHIRTTSVLHRFENTWKIVHEHSSPIRGIEYMAPIGD